MSEVKPLIATPEMLDGMRNGRQVRWYVLSLPSCWVLTGGVSISPTRRGCFSQGFASQSSAC